MNILPTYKGYTVDFRLKEFRKVNANYHFIEDDGSNPNSIEFLSFDSENGDRLLAQMIRKNLVPKEVLVNLF